MEQDHDEDKVITLKADGYEFPCNKRKLIACSDYFRAMFSNNFSEKDKEVIVLQDIDGEGLKILLDYAETGTFNIPSESTLALLQTAAMLQFTEIQSACEKEVFSSLSSESCLEVYSVTASLGLSNIAKSARTIALWNFSKIMETPKYLQLCKEALVEYLSDPSLFTGPNGEWTVWEAINMWIVKDEEERALYAKELLACLDFGLLSADDISNMLFYSVISENDELMEILESIRKYKKKQMTHSSYLSGTENIPSSTTTLQSDCDQFSENIKVQESVKFFLNCLTRKSSVSPSVIGFKNSPASVKKKAKNSDDECDYVKNDYRLSVTVSRGFLDLIPVLYVFNPSNNKIREEVSLTKLCHGPVLCSGFQVCSVGPSIYIIGGEFRHGHGDWNYSVWRYSTVTQKWIIENSLPMPRRHHMMCVVGPVIYILGGIGRYRVVQSSVHAYNTETGEWVHCPDMPHTVSNGAVCAFKGRVMVFTHEMQLLTYYPSTKKWSAIPLRSPTKYGYRAAHAWKDHIYLIDHCSTKVYKYSPEEGQTIVEFGCFIAPPFNICIVDGKIYSFSHTDSDDAVVEVLDIEDDQGYANISAHGDKISKQASEKDERREVVDQCDVPKKSAKVMWESGNYMFSTVCPASVAYSLGCFPLLKL